MTINESNSDPKPEKSEYIAPEPYILIHYELEIITNEAKIIKCPCYKTHNIIFVHSISLGQLACCKTYTVVAVPLNHMTLRAK